MVLVLPSHGELEAHNAMHRLISNMQFYTLVVKYRKYGTISHNASDTEHLHVITWEYESKCFKLYQYRSVTEILG